MTLSLHPHSHNSPHACSTLVIACCAVIVEVMSCGIYILDRELHRVWIIAKQVVVWIVLHLNTQSWNCEVYGKRVLRVLKTL